MTLPAALRSLSPLSIALGVSVAVHAVLLSVRFVAPEQFNRVFQDTPLEVILVNAHTQERPEKAQAIAQAALAGGGDAAQGRATSPGVYLAGDGTGILGADGAEMSGELAALTLLADLGKPGNPQRQQQLERRLATLQRFRQGLEQAFPFPEQWARQAPDELTVCRCEQISAGEIRATVRAGHWEINRVKAMCRVGMGRCQGRVCGAAAAELIACESGRAIDQVGRLRGQAPVKPLPFGLEIKP